MTRKVGITTTIPVEVVYAADMVPVDLNNVFVSHPDPGSLVERALEEGFPQNSCTWLKGIFGAVMEGGFERVIGVVRGDCSGTDVLMEALQVTGVEVIPFSYPYPPRRGDLEREIKRLAAELGSSLDAAESWRLKLRPVRRLLEELDRLCWDSDLVTGVENHTWLVSSSDFWGDPEGFGIELSGFLEEARARVPPETGGEGRFGRELRLGYSGVPPVTTGIYDFVESLGARFVFNEVQRQFSMPGDHDDLLEMYLSYTYPYTVAGRVEDINGQSSTREIDGLVHYVQSFCHRNIEDVIFAKALEPPMLTVECDCHGDLSAPVMNRLENFVNVLGENL